MKYPVVIIYGSAVADEFVLGGFSYDIRGREGNDYISDESNGLDSGAPDFFHGGKGRDTLISLYGSDELYGNKGSDEFFIVAGKHDVFVDGDSGHDVLTIWADRRVEIVNFGHDDWTIRIGDGKKITVEDVEHIFVAPTPVEYLDVV